MLTKNISKKQPLRGCFFFCSFTACFIKKKTIMKVTIYHYPSRQEMVSYEPFDYAVDHFFRFCEDNNLNPERIKNGYHAGGVGCDYRIMVEFEDGRERFVYWDKYQCLLL